MHHFTFNKSDHFQMPASNVQVLHFLDKAIRGPRFQAPQMPTGTLGLGQGEGGGAGAILGGPEEISFYHQMMLFCHIELI